MHAITCPFPKYFQSWYVFAHIFEYFTISFPLWHFLIFCLKNCMHGLTFYRICLASSFEKKLLKLLKVTKFAQLVQKWGSHEPRSKQKNNSFAEIKPNHKLSKKFYFIKISYALAKLWIECFSILCAFLLKSVTSSQTAGLGKVISADESTPGKRAFNYCQVGWHWTAG